MRVLLVVSLGLLFATSSVKMQGYTSFFTGDTSDVVTQPQAGILLAGGGSDSDAAMRWLLQRADGGDVVVLRASGSDGYNDYLFSDLNIDVNSVETIRFNGPQAATHPYVLRRIREAEALFIAGGDQTDYVNYWRGTPVGDELNFLINTKRITVGGTSAGMAVLCGVYYAPVNQSLISVEALNDPYHPNLEGFTNDPFLEIPYLGTTVTDTHFEQRDRQGRSLVFLARAYELVGEAARVIAANEATALAIEPDGLARAFGEWPLFDDYIFLLAPACDNGFAAPQVLEAGEPIVWEGQEEAVSVYRLPGTTNGTYTFDLVDWAPLNEAGDWQYWSAAAGQLSIDVNGAPPSICDPIFDNVRRLIRSELRLSPLPARDRLYIANPPDRITAAEIIDLNGRSLQRVTGETSSLALDGIVTGTYLLKLAYADGKAEVRKIIVQR